MQRAVVPLVVGFADALVEEHEIVRIQDHALVIAVEDQLAVADLDGPRLDAGFERDIGLSGERLLHRVEALDGIPLAIEFVRDIRAVIAITQRFHDGQVFVSALDLVGDAGFEDGVPCASHGHDRLAEALGKLGVGRAAAIEVAVVAGEEHVHVLAVADEVVVDRQARHVLPIKIIGEKVLRLRPGSRIARRHTRAEGGRLRLEGVVPLLVRREVEQLRRALVAGEAGVIHVEQLGVRGVLPVLETQVDHVERAATGGTCGAGLNERRSLRTHDHVGRRVDLPLAVDEGDGRILD